MPHKDPHSCWMSGTPQIKHIDFDLNVDFERCILSGCADYTFSTPLGDVLHLDTRDLHIQSVTNEANGSRELSWSLGAATFLGRALDVEGVRGLTQLRIRFQTSPQAAALQWLSPEQTSGKRHPFVFSQCQAILARTVFPCQDTPAVRFTYTAALRVPEALSAVMAAPAAGITAADGQRTFRFRMPHPIPSYLFALAAGNIASQSIGAISRVYAEPEVIEAAAWEFGGVDGMIAGARELFGDYIWDEFNLLVMPPSFPYGGMENPTLTYLTPTLLAGDRSLVSVVAHELAHSWTGNLVTNATWEDFWLNEGWTVYAERRILERLYGSEFAALQAVNGRNSLRDALKNFGDDSPYTKLKTDLAGIDPDEVFSSVPYEKGFLFLVAVERLVGRDSFDGFIADYIRQFRFSSITTEQFIDFLLKKLPVIRDRINLNRWIFSPGVPADAPVFESQLIADVRTAQQRWAGGDRDLQTQAERWSVDQKVLFLQELPERLTAADCAHIERIFAVAQTRNTEILLPWYCAAARSSYEPEYPAIRDFLSRIGRGKYLRPLYRALHQNPATRALAGELFAEYKDRYHSVGRNAVERILKT